MIMISRNFILIFTNFCVKVSFLTKLLLSTVVRAVVVAKLVLISILFLTLFLLALKAVVVAKLH